jgi:hypothetical protein
MPHRINIHLGVFELIGTLVVANLRPIANRPSTVAPVHPTCEL